MKNYYYDSIRFDSLYKAMKRCCRNLRWKESVVTYEFYGLRNTYKLKLSLHQGTYKLSKYQCFTIYEPKKREIVATRFKDRQLQMSFCENGLYDDFVEHFIIDNPACQTYKGTDFTIKRLIKQLRKYYVHYKTDGWILKCDIKKFFPSTNHDVAKQEVAKYVDDILVRDYINMVIDSFGDIGIGLGSQISQLIELSVLNGLDHYIRSQLRPDVYVRYMDDIIIVHHNKIELQSMLIKIRNYLESLKFTLNSKTQITPLRKGIHLMHWTFIIVPETGKILRKRDKDKFAKERRKIKKLWKKELEGKVAKGTTEQSLRSFLSNASKGNTYHRRKKIIKFYNQLTGLTYINKPKKKK